MENQEFTIEQAREFAKSLPFDEIVNAISDKLQTSLVIEKFKESFSCSEYRMIHTVDMTNKCGVFSSVIDECKLKISSSIQINRTTGKPFFFASVSLSYNMKDGGSNGITVARIQFDENGLTIR